MRFENPYEILGLSSGASEYEVKAAYEKLLEDDEKKADAAAAYEQIQKMKEEKPEEPAEEKTETSGEEKTESSAAPEKSAEAETKKGAAPSQIALGVLAIVVLAAVLAALILAAMGGKDVPAETAPTEMAAVTEASGETTLPGATEETVPATTPADGDPNNETCKGTYTASDEEVKAAADHVVASMADYQLTNAQLQVYYWMGVQSYVQNSGPYLQFMGLDVSKPLDTQACPLAEGQSWQQFFLKQALTSWQNYQAMAAEAELTGHQLDQELLDALKKLPEDMDAEAKANGFENGAALLANNVGAGASVEDYVHFMEIYHKGYGYFVDALEAQTPTDEQMEAYFTAHEAELKEGGITKEGKVASVRHILITPEDAEKEEDWANAEKKAREILDQYLSGDKTSESFAKLAGEYTMDPGSQANGGLYEDFPQGQMVPAFDQWSFDAARKNGDTDIVKTEYGYHIMYYVSSRLIWKDQVSQVMMKEAADKIIQDGASKYPMDIDFSTIVLGELKAQ